MSEVRLPRALINELVPGTNTLKDRGRLSPVKVSPTLNYDSLSTVSIQLKESDIELGQHEFVEVYGEFGSLGIFRVVSRSKKIKGIYTYNLNHAFDTLSDCVIEGVDTISGSVAEIISRLLQCQKEGIGSQKYWQLGTVQCTYSYTFDNSYDNVYDTLKDIADKYSDCCFTFDFSTFPWTLNFVNKSDEIVSELRLDRNIDEIEISENDNEQCTMLHLSVDTRDDPSVPEDAQGVTYRTITDAEAVANWGIIEKPIGIETKEIGGASEEAIQAWIDRYMSEHKNPELSIEITGEEYAKHTGEPMDRLQLGKICRTILKKYNNVFFERIVSINYPDILKTPRHFKATLASKKLTAGGAIAKLNKETKKSASRGGRRIQEVSDYFSDFLGHYIEENDQHWKSVYWDMYNGLTSRIEQTASYWQAEFDDQYNRLHGFVEITAQHWQATYEDGYMGLVSQVEQTAAYWRSLLADTYGGLYGLVEQTAQHWQSTLADTYRGLSSRVEQTAAYWKSELSSAYSGLSSRVTQTAETWKSELSSAYSGLSSRITQTANSWSAELNSKTSKASIILAINGNGGSSAQIAADNINLTGYVTASSLSTVDAKISNLMTGVTKASLIKVGTLQADSFSFKGDSGRWGTISLGSLKSMTVLTHSAENKDLDHYHSLTMSESDGVVTATIGKATSTEGTANFNIADTQFYKDAVSAAQKGVKVRAADITEYQTAYYNSTTHNTTIYVEAKATNGESGKQTFHVSGADAFAAGRLSGWNAACDKIFRSGNTIYCPKKNNLDGAATAKYTASYTASSYTKEVYKASSNSYTPGVYTPSSYTASSYTASSYSASSYSASSYTKESHSYTASSHSYTAPTMKLGISTYTSSFSMNLNKFTGKAVFSKGSDSYTASSHSYRASSYTASSYTPSSYSPSSYTKEKYTTSAYKASSNSYTASSLTPSVYKGSTFSWVEY